MISWRRPGTNAGSRCGDLPGRRRRRSHRGTLDAVDTIRIGADREPRRWHPGNSGLPRIHCPIAWVATVLLAAALAAAVGVAVHYRDEVLHHSTSALPPHDAPRQVTVFVVQSPLPALGALAGQITVFVALSSARRAEVVVSAHISGARPHATYELVGNDCATNGPDHTWATGVTDSRGSAQLIGHPWTVSTSDAYFLVLASRFLNQKRPGPAANGFFGKGPRGLSPVSGGVAPCAALDSLGSARHKASPRARVNQRSLPILVVSSTNIDSDLDPRPSANPTAGHPYGGRDVALPLTGCRSVVTPADVTELPEVTCRGLRSRRCLPLPVWEPR